VDILFDAVGKVWDKSMNILCYLKISAIIQILYDYMNMEDTIIIKPIPNNIVAVSGRSIIDVVRDKKYPDWYS
jgi:hypothetical protein